jgi:hypothetical protein
MSSGCLGRGWLPRGCVDLASEGEGVHPGDAEHGVVDAVALEAAVAEDLPGLHAGEDPNVIAVAVKGLAGKQRWRHGRVRTTTEHQTWQPWLRVGPVLPLPADLRPVGQRRPQVAEMWTMNPQVIVIECQSSAGGLSLGVMPWNVEQVQAL